MWTKHRSFSNRQSQFWKILQTPHVAECWQHFHSFVWSFVGSFWKFHSGNRKLKYQSMVYKKPLYPVLTLTENFLKSYHESVAKNQLCYLNLSNRQNFTKLAKIKKSGRNLQLIFTVWVKISVCNSPYNNFLSSLYFNCNILEVLPWACYKKRITFSKFKQSAKIQKIFEFVETCKSNRATTRPKPPSSWASFWMWIFWTDDLSM